jgi:hypothetical protein
MLSSVLEVEDLAPKSISAISSFLEETMQLKNGTIGFAPGLLPDADDTARSLMTLQLLGRNPTYAPMIEEFEVKDHFRTYDYERNPSFSANCNVLIALLYLDQVDQYEAQISKALDFVMLKFEQDDVADKWNVSPQYCAMLMMQAFIKILELHESSQLQRLDREMVNERIPVAICRILQRTLATQEEDGDWNKSLEETSYSVMTMAKCVRLSWNKSTANAIQNSLKRARDYIRTQYPLGEKSRFFWVEKTTYEPALLKIAYCSMALHTAHKEQQQLSTQAFNIPEMHSKKMGYLLSSLPNFSRKDLASVDVCLVEAGQLSRFLRRLRQDIVSRDQIPMTKDKYLDFIPVIWAMCNSKGKQVLPAEVVRDMVQISLLNYQIDEYMESVVSELGNYDIQELSKALRKDYNTSDDNAGSDLNGNGENHAHDDTRPQKRRKLQNGNHVANGTTNGTTNGSSNGNGTSQSSSVERILGVLRRFISYFVTHEAVTVAPSHIQDTLKKELYTFLFAHITHNADNATFQHIQRRRSNRTGFACSDIERNSYFKWVNTTGADDTSCPFSFQFFACLISRNLAIREGKAAKDGTMPYCFDGAYARYVAETLERRLAAMCRMYNDYGSVVRDKAEANLNSLDFTEFHYDGAKGANAGIANAKANGVNGEHRNGTEHAEGVATEEAEERKRKEQLMEISEFEREGMEHAMRRLGEIVPSKTAIDMLRVFIDVTDTFGLVYVQKDISSTKTKKEDK